MKRGVDEVDPRLLPILKDEDEGCDHEDESDDPARRELEAGGLR